MFTASIARVLPVGQRRDDPRWLLLIAYDRHQPPARADIAPIEARAVRQRVGHDMIGFRDCIDDRVDVTDELGVTARDLVLPDAAEEHDLTALRIGHGRGARFVRRHAGRLSHHPDEERRRAAPVGGQSPAGAPAHA